MIGSLTFANFNTLAFSSDSSVESSDRFVEQEIVAARDRKFLELKNIVGNQLFESLSYSDKVFMAETANSIDFGHAVDLEKIAKEIKNDDIF